jgi:hypothetical protein
MGIPLLYRSLCASKFRPLERSSGLERKNTRGGNLFPGEESACSKQGYCFEQADFRYRTLALQGLRMDCKADNANLEYLSVPLLAVRKEIMIVRSRSVVG